MRHAVLCLAACIAAGCSSSVHEVHYFKSKAESGAIPNYYRLDVSGCTFLADARYVSGYFDEAAVNAYFGETRQPANAKFEDTKPLDQDLAGKALVLLMSSNSDEIASQIGAVADSQEFTGALANLVGRSRFDAADDAAADLETIRADAKTTSALGTSLVAGLATDAAAGPAHDKMLDFANQLASVLGAGRSFKTLQEAATWFDAHRNRLGKE